MIIPSNRKSADGFDADYEWKAVLLLGLSFGLVGLDRWILAPLFPAMRAELHLDYADLGKVVGVLALTWGASAVIMGRLSDHIGRRRVLLPALIGFSLLSGVTGLVGGLSGLLLTRGVMGIGEGAFCPASVAATGEASRPHRRGLNQGMQMSSFALFGFGFAPIIATQLLRIVPSWRVVFMLVAMPGLILAFLLWRVLREPGDLSHLCAVEPSPKIATRWLDVLRSGNVRIATLGLLCAMSCIFVMGALVPNYLVDEMKLTPTTMGFVMSALGWGGFIGEFVMPGLSDHIGRRWASVISFAGAATGTWFFAHTIANPLFLFLWLGFTAFFCLGLLSMLTGPVAVEAVSPALAASAVGVVSGAGEIFGGGVAPVIAGYVAEAHGLAAAVLWVPLAGLIAGFFILLMLRETAPRLRDANTDPLHEAMGA